MYWCGYGGNNCGRNGDEDVGLGKIFAVTLGRAGCSLGPVSPFRKEWRQKRDEKDSAWQ